MDGISHLRFIIAMNLLPLLAVPVGIWLLFTGNVSAVDLALLGLMFVVAGLGVSTGYHRLLSHRAFKASRGVRFAFTSAGAIAAQGPPMIWVAHHRRHHRHADKPGDPHSPYVDQPSLLKGAIHSHVGWLFDKDLTSDPIRYCPDLARDKDVRFISNNFVWFVLGGVLAPGLIGYAVTGGQVSALFTGMLWGGLIRMFLSNQVTWAVNSFGHVTGNRPFPTSDESRNNWWLAIPSFGEAWHNSHHAFPRSYRHGMRWYQVDLSAWIIVALEKLHVVSDVVRIGRDAQDAFVVARSDRGGGGRAFAHDVPTPLAARQREHVMVATDVE